MAWLRRRLRHLPIQVRLTLWYTASLVVLLIGYNIWLNWRLEKSLLAQVDTSLALAARQAQAAVLTAGGSPTFIQSEALVGLEKDFALALVAPDGSLVEKRGDAQAPVLHHPQRGFRTVESRRAVEEDMWRVYSVPIEGGWLQVAHSLGQNQATLESLEGEFRFTFPVLITLAVIGGLFLARRALRPIDRITRTAGEIDVRDLDRRLAYEGARDEVGRLAATFDDMLARLQAGFERERRFTADAAHELRTPLTALRGQIEVALTRERTPADYSATLHTLQEQVDRLIRLANDLLFMARLDHRLPALAPELIVLDDCLPLLIDAVQALASQKGLQLATDFTPALTFNGPLDLFMRLIHNLLDNAIKYTPAGGTVTLGCARHATSIAVWVQDSGPGIPAAHLPFIFERFYRLESDRARHTAAGAGLGLAIAREIAHALGGTLTVSSTAGLGSTFTLRLPA